MFPRFLLVTGLLAIAMSAVDPAFGRPRRRATVSHAPARTVAGSNPTLTQPLKSVTYPVADLIVPISSRPNLDVEPLPGPRRAKSKDVGGAAEESEARLMVWEGSAGSKLLPGQTTETLLIELLKNTVAPNSWAETGGQGTIQFYPLGLSIIVNQTQEIHEEVQGLLAALRRLYDIEAAVEVRVVTTTPAAFEKACRELNFKRGAEKDHPATEGKRTVAPKGKRWTAFIANDEVRQLLSLLQEDRATNILQAPKTTAFNGQNFCLEIAENRFFLTSLEVVSPENGDDFYFVPNQSPWVTGLSLGMQCVVSADHRSVRVQLKGYWSQLAGPVELQPVETRLTTKNDQGKVEETPFRMYLQKPRFAQVKLDEALNIPDGGAALISCGVVPMEVERNDLTAKLSRFCGCDVKTTSADRHVFFLVTPRVIVNEVQETPFLGNPSRGRDSPAATTVR